jgi:monoamine oxidase
MRIHRRDLLKLGAWAVSTGIISASAARAAAVHREPIALIPGKQQRILIVGAGLSGLVAAYELRKLGHEVTVLEAQRRPGGRVYSLREPFSDGLYVEVGAARIPDNHNLTLRYVSEFNLPLTPFYPTGSRMYSIGGKRIRADASGEWVCGEAPLDLKPEEKPLGQWALLEKYIGGAMAELGDPFKIDYTSKTARGFDSVTTAEYLRQQGASEAANDLMSWPWATAKDDRYSFLWSLREIAYESQEKTRSKIVGGNDKLPRAFAATMKDAIHYGSPVVRIEQDDQRVRAVVSRGGATETFEADRLLCTVPFPALRDVDIAPALSPARRRVINELAYDKIVRATLQSRTRYWEKDGFNGFGHSDTPQQIWHFTHDQPGPRGLLVSFLCGGTGERVGDMEPEARERFLVAEMERAHPGLRENYEGMFVHVWHKHQWAKGALALPSPGQMTGMCVGAEKPEGRLHFAGEHLSHFSGWMQGALESGLRAVGEIAGLSTAIPVPTRA